METKKYTKEELQEIEEGKIHITKELLREWIKENKKDLSKLDTSKITDMSFLFYYSEFNGDISQWNVSNVTNMNSMFYNSKFNGDISQWNVSNVTNMSYIFKDSEFNEDISNWNVSNVTDMSFMFQNAKFNGDISQWNVSNVTDITSMFQNSKFNGDISNWNVSNINKMEFVFYHSQFNGNISQWEFYSIKYLQDFITKSKLSNENYSKLLIQLSKFTLPQYIEIEINSKINSKKALKSKEILVNKYNWKIKDGGIEMPPKRNNTLNKEIFKETSELNLF